MSARFKLLPGRWDTKYGPKAQTSTFGGSIGSDRVQVGFAFRQELPGGRHVVLGPGFEKSSAVLTNAA